MQVNRQRTGKVSASYPQRTGNAPHIGSIGKHTKTSSNIVNLVPIAPEPHGRRMETAREAQVSDC